MQPKNVKMADVRDMYSAHAMMRREFRLLPQLIRGVARGDTRRAKVVADHADKICSFLHSHHHGEDLYLWPLLLERGGAKTEQIVPTMEKQHHGIEEALTIAGERLSQWRSTAQGGTELAEAFQLLTDRLVEHMALEEREILPLAEQYVTAAEWGKLGEHGMTNTPKSDLILGFGMVMYESDAEATKAILADAPLFARVVMPLMARRRYTSHAKRIYGTSTPPRIGR
ncbi:hemerythrin domain-containing protein [Micromonospora sp. NPDC049559]|uniref:hemerythrin domain-containing protein n=1 Tax=Micromonospora sp. NPDC049559 TaxID=3155923 RepID=UPI003444F2B0